MAAPRPRVIVHLDADAFFVSVEQVLHPELKGLKVAVGGLHRGIISSASYEARACGVYTPMPTARAVRVCPDLKVVPHTPGVYGQYSRRLFTLCENVTPLIEKVSVDEGYLDLTPCGFATFAEGVARARVLQETIHRELGITVSIGVASNRLVSAIASKWRKPRGFTVVEPGTEAEFLRPLSVGRLPGVGAKTEASLQKEGITSIDELLAAPSEILRRCLGSGWEGVLQAAQGLDDRELELERGEAKSHSQQETFGRDLKRVEDVLPVLKGMVDDLLPDIRAEGKRARTLTVKVRYPDLSYTSAGHTLPVASALEVDFYPWLEPLLRRAWSRREGIRLASVRFSELEEPAVQMDLFAQDAEKRQRLAKVLDQLRGQEGPRAVVRGWSLQRPDNSRR